MNQQIKIQKQNSQINSEKNSIANYSHSKTDGLMHV